MSSASIDKPNKRKHNFVQKCPHCPLYVKPKNMAKHRGKIYKPAFFSVLLDVNIVLRLFNLRE